MIEINNTTSHKINVPKIRKITETFLRAYKKPRAAVSLAVVGPARIKRLNRDYRQMDKATDVLSFPADPSQAEPSYLGEVIINRDETLRLSKYKEVLAELDIPPFRSRKAHEEYLFYFLFVHGLLHLIGYDDSNDALRREMLIRGRDFLKKML